MFNETDETKKLHLEQFDRTIRTIGDEHLFEYLDWEKQFHQQVNRTSRIPSRTIDRFEDLPNELCEELFQYWKSLVCPDTSCRCDDRSSKSQEEEDHHHSSKESASPSPEDADEEPPPAEICLCAQCSCPCLKNDVEEEKIAEVRVKDEELITVDQSQQTEDVELEPSRRSTANDDGEEIRISTCFANRNDRWSQQLDPLQRETNDEKNLQWRCFLFFRTFSITLIDD